MMYLALILCNPHNSHMWEVLFWFYKWKDWSFGEFGYLQVEKQVFQAVVNKCV